MTMMHKLYVLVGVPGSGKSTWIQRQDWSYKCAYISTDKFVEAFARSQGKTYSEVFEDFMPDAVNLMIEEVIKARGEGQDIIWDQTSTTVASRRKKLTMLPNYHAIAIVFKRPSDEELKRRLDSRIGKEIPWSVIESMTEGYEEPTVEEGFDEIWYAV